MTRYLKILALAVALPLQMHAIEIDFGSSGSLLRISGVSDTFTFRNIQGDSIPSPGYGFQVNSTGDSQGDHGRIMGRWNIGAVSTVGDTQTTTELGLSSGSPELMLWDGNPGNVLLASVAWTEMSSVYNALNDTTSLRIRGSISGITYSGAENDLQALRDNLDGDGLLTVLFSFSGNNSLTQLKAAGGNVDTTFNGYLEAAGEQIPDGGSAVLLLGSAFLMLGFVRRKVTV